MAYKVLSNLSIEELEELVSNNTITDDIEYDNVEYDVNDDMNDINNSVNVVNELEEQLDVIESSNDVSIEMLDELKIRYIKASITTGIKFKNNKLSLEDITGSDIISISTESIREYVVTIIEKIKAWLKAFWIKIKRWYLLLNIEMKKELAEATALVEQIKDYTKDRKDDMNIGIEKINLYKKISAIKHISKNNATSVIDTYSAYLDSDTLPMLAITGDEFKGYENVEVKVSKLSRVTDSRGYETINEGIEPKLPEDINYDNADVMVFAPHGDKFSALTFVNAGDKEETIIDIRYTKHQLINITGDISVIDDFKVSTLEVLLEVIKNSISGVKKQYDIGVKYEESCGKLLSKLEKQAKDNPNDKELADKLRILRKLAVMQNEILIDNIFCLKNVIKDMLHILRLGMKTINLDIQAVKKPKHENYDDIPDFSTAEDDHREAEFLIDEFIKDKNWKVLETKLNSLTAKRFPDLKQKIEEALKNK